MTLMIRRLALFCMMGLSATLAQAQDVVLIAGKGHETYQDIQGVMHGFSDVDHAELALHKWGRA